ncbi:Uncharacterised protein [Vibrio cholerae]|nr:Uncharacterised protein [Vibrio cholerae]
MCYGFYAGVSNALAQSLSHRRALYVNEPAASASHPQIRDPQQPCSFLHQQVALISGLLVFQFLHSVL